MPASVALTHHVRRGLTYLPSKQVEVITVKGFMTAVVACIACGIAGCATPKLLPDNEDTDASVEVEKVDYCTEYPWSNPCIAKATYRI